MFRGYLWGPSRAEFVVYERIRANENLGLTPAERSQLVLAVVSDVVLRNEVPEIAAMKRYRQFFFFGSTF